MKDRFLSAVHDYNMFSVGDKIVVGVSGGADSMCLLSLLNECASEYGIKVIAAHFNHGIRGEEADRDERFVIKYCKNNNIDITTRTADVPVTAEKTGESIEQCARRLRYEFLRSVSATAKIATAHTAADSIETMLMNLSRGSGLHGLCGIAPVRDDIIRPLIYFTREDTEEYCRENSIDYVTDSTNLSTDYSRNAMRLNVIPQLKRIYPAFSSNALRCMSILKDEDEYMLETAKKLLAESEKDNDALDINILNSIPMAMRRRVIALFVSRKLKYDISFRHIELICEMINSGHGAIELPFGEKIKCSCERLCFEQPKQENSEYLEIVIPETGGSFVFYDRIIEITIEDRSATDVYGKNVIRTAIPDLSTLVLRSRKQGDKLTVAARNCTKSIKKLLYEADIVPEKRNRTAIIADKDGLIYADGFGLDKSRIPDKDASKIMIIKTGWVNNE